MPLQSAYGERTINELLLMFKCRQINLNPGFQRNSVWSLTDRRRLIQSILARYPLPSIFLYVSFRQACMTSPGRTDKVSLAPED
jgi:hypothetical protein